MVLDLDPSEGFTRPIGAREIKALLENLGLQPSVMTTGSWSLYVAIPLNRRDDFGTVRDFAGDVAWLLIRRCPDLAITAQLKAKRRGKHFVGTISDSYGQTSIAPYAIRIQRTRQGS